MKQVLRLDAVKSKTTHVFRPTEGYWELGPLPMPQTDHAGTECDPPAGTADGSRHMLASPGGVDLEFTWVAAEKAWERWGGNRMAFLAEYLSRHNWKYIGPVT